ncbi:MAG: hypothetical protein ACKVVT_18675 [Dehalococcoidia bacterium]
MSAAGIVRASTTAWVRFYTTGLPREAREGRRQEIACDVWEQLRAGDLRGTATRCLRGIPDDLTWRASQMHPARPFQRAAEGARLAAGTAGRWTVRRGFPGLAFGLAALYVLIGAILLVSLVGGDEGTKGDRLIGGIFLLVSGGFVYGGWELIPQRRLLGLGVVGIGSIPWALGVQQGGVLPAVTVVILTGALLRAWSAGRLKSRA